MSDLERSKLFSAMTDAYLMEALNNAVTPGRASTDRASEFKHPRVMKAIMSSQWAILPEALEQIVLIAEGLNESPESVAQSLGRPLDNSDTTQVHDKTAVIPVRGPIFRYANLMTEVSGATSVEVLMKDFNAALSDPTVNRIVLDIDSPGGQVTGINEFSNMIYEARGEIPIIAYVSGMGASAAYWIASAADEIVVDHTAIIGSVGVVSTIDARKTDGVVEIVSTQSPNKRPDVNTEYGRAQVQRTVDDLADVFIETVARNRGIDKDVVLEMYGQGDVLVGRKAVEAGMADRVDSLDSLIAGVSGVNSEVIVMAEQPVATSPEITREYIASQFPAIADAFREEGIAGARDDILAEGAKVERERIQSVEKQLIPGHEALIESLKFDGSTTGPEAAVQVLAAEKAYKEAELDAREADAIEPMEQVDPAASIDVDAEAPLEDRCEAAWKKSKALRAEFLDDFGAYVAFEKANAAGQVKQLKREA